MKTIAKQKKIAILSMLFNWPSTAGGIIHTTELGKFLTAFGFDVKHFSAKFDPWKIGQIQGEPRHPVESIEFVHSDWNEAGIRKRFSDRLDRFQPDFVIVTDSWSTKPLLAEAASQFKYLIRIAAQECICPLNNVRLLKNENGFYSCPKHQFATPKTCSSCVTRLDHHSGSLHHAERMLGGFYEANYTARLNNAFANAHCILAVNPFVKTILDPYCQDVRVVPSGFDETRFLPAEKKAETSRKAFVFAGLATEPMKGYATAIEAGRMLYEQRQDFEILVTDTNPNQDDLPFVRHIGWQSQTKLPHILSNAYALLFPTVAEEGLGRSAIEAMAMKLPVIASRIGGLRSTVQDFGTGLLTEPNSPNDLAAKMNLLLDDPTLASSLGIRGRAKFESEFTWSSVINKHYIPLFCSTNN